MAKAAAMRAPEIEASDTTTVHEGIIPPEITAKIVKFARDGDHVQIWFYSKLVDPLTHASPVIAAVAVVNLPAKAFDAFIAEGMVKVAAQFADGHGIGV